MDHARQKRMSVAFWLLVLLAISGRFAVAQEELSEQSIEGDTADSLVVFASHTSIQATENDSRDFPKGAMWMLTPLRGMSAAQNSGYDQVYAIAKFTIVVACVFLWLRLMHVSSTSETVDKSGKPDEGIARNWTTRIFLGGLAGISIAMILPATVWAAGILVAATVVPYGIFIRSQKQRLGDAASKLSYLPLVSNRPRQPVVFEAYGPAEEAESSPPQTSIRLLSKSALRNDNQHLSKSVEKSPAFQYVLSVIDRAVRSSATDLHINSRPNHVEVKQRVDGTLEPLPELPREAGLAVINILKVLSELSIADRRRSQDGSFLVEVNGRRLSFRVSSQGTQSGEKLSIRILDPSKSSTRLRSLGMPAAIEESLEKQLLQRHGLILFVGATGAGKSTTACAALQLIDSTTRNVVSIEDPIEYQIPSIDQIEVNLKAGQTFESALRSVLRLDADVIFVGEIRDAETAKIALQAAQTGQLVLATMHATGAVGGFQRFANLTGDPTGVASAVRAVVAQTLMRKLCPKCRTEYSPDEDVANTVGSGADESLFRSNTELKLLCPTCNGRKFMRRTAVYELVEANSELRELVREQASQAQLTEAAVRQGMIPIRDHGTTLVREGVISVNELNRVLGE